MRSERFERIAAGLVDAARRFEARGWLLGTSGNLSGLVNREPLRLAITPSGAFKGDLGPERILQIDERGLTLGSADRPSAEALLHLAIIRARQAAAVFHTHSVWGTVLSDAYMADGGLLIEGYEMLKGLAGVRTHQHREWVPIVENDQDMARLANAVADALGRHPASHAFLLLRHGLYTWGSDLDEARRHVEILEFLLETIGCSMGLKRAAERAALGTVDT